MGFIKHGAPERTIASATQLDTDKETGLPKVTAHQDFVQDQPKPEPKADANSDQMR